MTPAAATPAPVRVATCSCGQLSVVCEGEPVRVSICHCLQCQRRTGSVFAVQARFPRSGVTIAGEASRWSRTGDSGDRVTFGFCATCGATLFWEPEALPDFVSVAVGAFGDAGFPAPAVSIYEERRHPWTASLETLPLHREF